MRLKAGRKLYSTKSVASPADAVSIMQRELATYDREVVCVVNLNCKHQPINFSITSIGSLSYSIFDITNILKAGILSNAHTFLVLHNHPSGNTEPSIEDREATKKLILAGRLLGLPCLDHIIIAGNGKETRSMRENRDVDFTPEMEDVMNGVSLLAEEAAVAYGEKDLPPWESTPPSEEQGRKAEEEKLTLHFAKGLCTFFTSKKGTELARIKIPNTTFESWPSFVLPAGNVRESRFGKGYWAKIAADGRTTLSISRKVTGDDGKERWDNRTMVVNNRQLLAMVESYRQVKEMPEKAEKAEEKETPEKAKEPLPKPKKKSR